MHSSDDLPGLAKSPDLPSTASLGGIRDKSYRQGGIIGLLRTAIERVY